MNQILSQDEIDALLGGIDEGSDETGATEPDQHQDQGDIISYDFENAARMTRVKFPAFDVINDQFNRGIRSTLSSILRVMVDSSTVPVEIITFKEFLQRVPVPSSLHVLKMSPLRGHMMMLVDSQLVFCVVEIFLGSRNFSQSRIEGREFTSIEQRLIQRIVNSLLGDMEKAWQPVNPVEIKYSRSEINPQFAKIAQDDDTVFVFKFQLDIEEISGMISICIPFDVLQPIKAKLQTTFQGEKLDDPVWQKRLITNLYNTEVNATVPLGTATLTGAQLLDLEEGDIIQLETKIDDMLHALIGGEPKFQGRPGIFKGSMAFRIENIIMPEAIEE